MKTGEANKMASETSQESNEATTQQQDQQASSSQALDTRTSVQKKEKYRFAANIPSDKTAAEREYAEYILENEEDNAKVPDVLLDVPVVKVDEIKFELDDLRAHVAVLAEAGNFVQLNVGAAVSLGKVELDIQGVETQALLEARLDNVGAILARVLTSLDRNPELLESVGEALGDVGGGARDLLGDTGDVVKSAGKGAESAVQDVGKGAGKGVAGIGQGAQQGVEGLGQGAQQGVEGLGQGAQQGVEGLGQGAQQGVEGVGQGAQQGVGQLGQGGGS
jgi:hypothetical protein